MARFNSRLFSGAAACCLLLLLGPAWAAKPSKIPTAEAIFVSVLHSEEFAYTGRQVTTSWRSGSASEVQVFHLPADYRRLQYLNPVSRRGRLLVSDGHQEWLYDPQRRTLQHRRLSPGALDDDDYLSYTLLRANYLLAVDPRRHRWADRSVFLVTLKRPGRMTLARRFWIDSGSGLILKREHYGEDGRLVMTVAFTDITYHPKLRLSLFNLTGLGSQKGVTVAELPSPWEAPVALAAADRELEGKARVWPQLAGYRLIGATKTVVGGKPLLHLRYSDGLNLVSVFELRRTQTRRPTAVSGHPFPLGMASAHLIQHGALTTLNWDTPALNITLMGEASAARLRALALAAR